MNNLGIALVAALLTIAALPAVAGALEASGIALVGVAKCSGAALRTAARPTDPTTPSGDAMQIEERVAPAAEAWLRDYLDFHALVRDDGSTRVAVVPWPALRTHAN